MAVPNFGQQFVESFSVGFSIGQKMQERQAKDALGQSAGQLQTISQQVRSGEADWEDPAVKQQTAELLGAAFGAAPNAGASAAELKAMIPDLNETARMAARDLTRDLLVNWGTDAALDNQRALAMLTGEEAVGQFTDEGKLVVKPLNDDNRDRVMVYDQDMVNRQLALLEDEEGGGQFVMNFQRQMLEASERAAENKRRGAREDRSFEQRQREHRDDNVYRAGVLDIRDEELDIRRQDAAIDARRTEALATQTEQKAARAAQEAERAERSLPTEIQEALNDQVTMANYATDGTPFGELYQDNPLEANRYVAWAYQVLRDNPEWAQQNNLSLDLVGALYGANMMIEAQQKRQ